MAWPRCSVGADATGQVTRVYRDRLPSAAMSPPSQRLEPVTLKGRRVTLVPLELEHVPGLAEVGLDPALWQWTLARPTDEAGIRAWAQAAIANRDAGTELPFATLDAATGRPIGSSRYMNIVLDHRRLEIGWTWVAGAWQRSGANREAKLLMLAHAFDTLGCRRVEFKTDSRNERSRTALLGIGAQFEGIFRNHMVMPERPDASLGVLQRHRRGVARGSSPARGTARGLIPSAMIGGPGPGPGRSAGRHRPVPTEGFRGRAHRPRPGQRRRVVRRGHASCPTTSCPSTSGNDWWKLLAVALVFALVNSYIKPIVKALSMPIGLMTMGLVAFVINAAMLLLVALDLEQPEARLQGRRLPARTSPRTRSSARSSGRVIISVVSTLASVALSPRKLV